MERIGLEKFLSINVKKMTGDSMRSNKKLRGDYNGKKRKLGK